MRTNISSVSSMHLHLHTYASALELRAYQALRASEVSIQVPNQLTAWHKSWATSNSRWKSENESSVYWERYTVLSLPKGRWKVSLTSGVSGYRLTYHWAELAHRIHTAMTLWMQNRTPQLKIAGFSRSAIVRQSGSLALSCVRILNVSHQLTGYTRQLALCDGFAYGSILPANWAIYSP